MMCSKNRRMLHLVAIAFGFLGSQAIAKTEVETVLEAFWESGKTEVYPVKREQNHFTAKKYEYLKKSIKNAKNIDEFSEIVNPFLNSLKLSHTQFYTSSDVEFYFVRSLFSTKNIQTPKLFHIGAQYKKEQNFYRVIATLEGYPADIQGVRRGDLILSCDSQPFVPGKSFKDGHESVLKIKRDTHEFSVQVTPVFESFHLSLKNALSNSVRTYNEGGKNIGYIHLWSGTHPEILEEFKLLLKSKLSNVDGLILDLRDGFGGAWYEYLDPFFKNREDFFIATQIDRFNKRTIWPLDKMADHEYFDKPMVVIINEGVRSGKESLAYQFKKSKRAKLVGTKTAGAFVGGKGIFSDKPVDYIFYLGVFELLLDGKKVEGIGIKPDVSVGYPLNLPFKKDPQFEKAKEVLFH